MSLFASFNFTHHFEAGRVCPISLVRIISKLRRELLDFLLSVVRRPPSVTLCGFASFCTTGASQDPKFFLGLLHFLFMAYPEPMNTEKELAVGRVNPPSPRKPRILLAASGSVAAIKFANLCHCFSEWGEVKAVATKASLHFIDRTALPKDVILYTDEDEWSSWSKIGDSVLHIDLRRWADVMVIAPLSANTLGKIAGGLCDNLLMCIVRAWDYSKPLFVAPAMNTFMWKNPFTERHIMTLDELGVSLIPPVTKRLACGDYGNGAMAEPSLIYSTVRLFFESRPLPSE